MAEDEAIKRLEIIIEALELQKALAMIERAGATGYTVIPRIYGKGHRGIRTELGFSDVLKNVMIIVIARETVAEQIAQDVGPLFERYAGLLTVTAVESCYGFDK